MLQGAPGLHRLRAGRAVTAQDCQDAGGCVDKLGPLCGQSVSCWFLLLLLLFAGCCFLVVVVCLFVVVFCLFFVLVWLFWVLLLLFLCLCVCVCVRERESVCVGGDVLV